MKTKCLLVTCCIVFAMLWCCSHCHYSQLRNATITIGGDTITIGKENNTLVFMFPELDSIWKPTYQYAVFILPNTPVSQYHELLDTLSQTDHYTKDNTFIVCRSNERKYINLSIPGYSYFVPSLFTVDRLCEKTGFYTVRKEDEKYIFDKKELPDE